MGISDCPRVYNDARARVVAVQPSADQIGLPPRLLQVILAPKEEEHPSLKQIAALSNSSFMIRRNERTARLLTTSDP